MNRKLRILMVAPGSFFSDYGAHVRIVEEARALQRQGHAVTIITYYLGRDLPDLEIIRTRPTPWRADYEVGSSLHRIAFDVLLAWTGVTTVLWRRFDIVHAHLHDGAFIGYFLSRLLRVPLVADFQGSMTSEMVDHGFLDPTGPWYRWWRLLETRIDEFPDVILTSTNQTAVLLEQHFNCDARRVQPLPDSVNMDFFSPTALTPEQRSARRAALGLAPDQEVVVYLGLLTDYQGIPLLLQAARILKDQGAVVRFLIGGFPVERYRHMAVEMGIEETVVFTGKIPREETPIHLALGDIAVAPKRSLTEGCGKILEYMAMGLPTVVFDTPQNREYLGSLGAYAGQSGDPAALADAIASFLNRPQRRADLGQRLRARAARHFSWDRAGRQLLTVYGKILKCDPTEET